MRAIVYRGAGGPEVVALAQVPDPVPAAGQVRVRVTAVGLNRADVIQRRGGYPAPPGWPADIPGIEYAGRIDGLGEGVTRWSVGDRVMGLVGGGAHAELLTVHEREVMPVPAALSDEAAAAIPEAYLTAYDALVTRGRLGPGERVLIHAVGSGISTAAVQLAKWLGATVIGTSRTPAKLDRARSLGMDTGVELGRPGYREAVGAPVHVILDYLGGPALDDNLALLAPKGRLVLLGTLQGAIAERADLGRILRSRLELIGTVMRSRSHEEKVPLVDEIIARVLPLFSASQPRLTPVVGATFPMTAMVDAHAAMEKNEVFGKIVLEW
jgi:putative PIG3 family NAD(P)H quinone oxidoreductase